MLIVFPLKSASTPLLFVWFKLVKLMWPILCHLCIIIPPFCTKVNKNQIATPIACLLNFFLWPRSTGKEGHVCSEKMDWIFLKAIGHFILTLFYTVLLHFSTRCRQSQCDDCIHCVYKTLGRPS